MRNLRKNITGRGWFRLENNWGLLMNVVRLTVVSVLTFVTIMKQEKFLFRACILVFDFIIIYFLSKGIKRYDWVANYCGTILATIMYLQMTEMNLKFKYFRINEGYLIQIAASLVFSTCVTTNWKIACITQTLLHIHGLLRLGSKFGTLGDYYYPSTFIALIFFIVGAYSYSKTLKLEFLANYKQRKTLESQKAILDSVSEGVLIVNANKGVKYLNPKIKDTFDIGAFYKSDSVVNEMKATQILISKELDRAIKKYSFEYSNIHRHVKKDPEKFLSDLLNDFEVTIIDNEQDQNADNPNENAQNESHSQAERFLEYRQGQPTLAQFLESECEAIMNSNNISKESKICMEYRHLNIHHETQKREFVIKTTLVESDLESADDVLFMHMFIDTTKIGQLEEAKAQNHYQRQMLSNVSHEFRTPLNSITASLELMRMQEYGKNNRFLQIASSSCSILGMLVEDILDHAKIESGVFRINEEEFTMTQCINEIYEVFSLQTNGKGLELKINIEEKLRNMPILSDKQRIKQVLMNLISNALKFTDTGSITVEVSESNNELEESKIHEERKYLENDSIDYSKVHIEPSELSENQQIRYDVDKYSFSVNKSLFKVQESTESRLQNKTTITLKVIDTGIGIAQADQKSLFKLFGKLSSNHDRNKTGCGLGLTICKKLIEKLGGTISLSSKENIGTTVECSFICKY
ncbi:unnamed protein product [Moneuplotes crassus]|uniref:histidine kinase n=1 Tax=Euplotes crassus TaxID=5936 RepID=A0AAD1Y0P5_EUPCR|nr:unnamed protein product [Moneuplotes crassus]